MDEGDWADDYYMSESDVEGSIQRDRRPARSHEYIQGKSDGVREGLTIALMLIQQALDSEPPEKTSIESSEGDRPLCQNVREANPGKEHLDTPIIALGFSKRILTVFKREGIHYVGDIPVVSGSATGRSLEHFRNFGYVSIADVRKILGELGLKLPYSPEPIE